MAHHPKFSPFRVVGYTLNSHVLGLALISFELLEGLPHEADQFRMENVEYMTILNRCFKV